MSKSNLISIASAVFLVVTFIGLSILIIIPKKSPQSNKENSYVTSQEQKNKKYIKGISPADVYINLENRGFKTEKKVGSTDGLRYQYWTNIKKDSEIDYQVDTFTDGSSLDVTSIQAKATLTGEKSIDASKSFFAFVSTVTFDGNDPEKVKKWILDNFETNEAKLVINEVEFTILSPTPAVKRLKIKPVE